VLRSIYSAIAFIAENPHGAAATDESTVRVKVIVEYPYKIFYRIGTDAAEVLHIRHSARRPWRGVER
jgi:plasmid stabilization system protein ParE